MAFRGRFRPVRHSDHAVPEVHPRSLLGPVEGLDIRIWRRVSGTETLLLAQAGRRSGPAVQRNRFRRRVRMALFHLLAEHPLPSAVILWVRPSRRAPEGCRIPYSSVLGQLRLALSRFQARQA